MTCKTYAMHTFTSSCWYQIRSCLYCKLWPLATELYGTKGCRNRQYDTANTYWFPYIQHGMYIEPLVRLLIILNYYRDHNALTPGPALLVLSIEIIDIKYNHPWVHTPQRNAKNIILFCKTAVSQIYKHYTWKINILTRSAVNTGRWDVDIHGCYSLVKIDFAPICTCKDDRQIWHNNSTPRSRDFAWWRHNAESEKTVLSDNGEMSDW